MTMSFSTVFLFVFLKETFTFISYIYWDMTLSFDIDYYSKPGRPHLSWLVLFTVIMDDIVFPTILHFCPAKAHIRLRGSNASSGGQRRTAKT